MRQPMIWGEPESTFLRKFFDGVDRAVTEEMQAGRTLLEESLTFALCRLLDGQSTFQRMLEYPLKDLNADLDRCGSGTALTIEFETNEHKKTYEAAVSHADLGIIIRRESSVFGPAHNKAIIVQAKKLYPARDGYKLTSAYDGFDPAQFKALKELADKGHWEGIYYFFYNPKVASFAEPDVKVLRALESRFASQLSWPYSAFPFWHPEMEHVLHMLARRGGYIDKIGPLPERASSDELVRLRQQAVDSRPGMRVLAVWSVNELVNARQRIKNSFKLEECYRHALSEQLWCSNGTVPFPCLSSFFVDYLMACIRGSDSETIINIAQGNVPENQNPPTAASPSIAARHTLRITVRNTLPSMDVSFQQ